MSSNNEETVVNSTNKLKEILSNKPKNIAAAINLFDECVGCSSCMNSCKAGAISLKPNKNGFLNPIIDDKKCVSCMLCIKKCPVLNFSYKNDIHPKCYASIADDKTRDSSSSGGAFSVIANYVLEIGGYVVGAVFDEEFRVHHVIASNKDELEKMKGSKYYQSDLKTVFAVVEKRLKENKIILFSGMPCQVAGLYAFLGKEYSNLYTIDILCHGISSYKVFKKYHTDILDNKKIVDLKFKAKKPWGWHAGTNIIFEDGTKYSSPCEKDPFFVSYLNSISKNMPCGTCKFNRLPRQGDFTLADFWRIQNYDPMLNDNKGTSMVFANNHKADKLYELCEKEFKISKKVPIEYAIAGNWAITKPFPHNIGRKQFFENLDSVDFINNINNLALPKYEEHSSINNIVDIVKKNIKDRQLIMIIDNKSFSKSILNQLSLENKKIIEMPSNNHSFVANSIKNKNKKFYVLWLSLPCNKENVLLLERLGYKFEKDCLLSGILPIVLENVDLKKGYSDKYGNIIKGYDGFLKKIVFRGFNNHIFVGKNSSLSNIDYFDLSNNNHIFIGNNVSFLNKGAKFELYGGLCDGYNYIRIGNHSSFRDVLFRMYADPNRSSILIGNSCTFESNLCLHSNMGKKIIIGNDCMFSRNIVVFAGDGHSMFDLNTMKQSNGYDKRDDYKNNIVIGNHVWVCFRSNILTGSYIGDGSTIGAASVVKGMFSNNCVIAGNPAKTVKKNTTWSRFNTNNIDSCNGYIYKTMDSSNPPISNKKVLVIGGTRQNGAALVNKLISLGNDVTIATRGRKSDNFGPLVKRIHLDVSDSTSTKNALLNKKYDIVYHNLAYSSNYLKNVLDYVSCNKVVELSTIGVYSSNANANVQEKTFDPYRERFTWNSEPKNYGLGKREAECALFQTYKSIPSVAVRIPFVIPTDRLDYFCDCIINNKPMSIPNLDAYHCFIKTTEIADFLVWVASQDVYGPINLSSDGYVKIIDIINYISEKVKKKPIIDISGAPSPFCQNIYLNLDVAKKNGYYPLKLDSWFWKALDQHIAKALANKHQ